MNIIKWLDVAHDFIHELFVNPGFKMCTKYHQNPVHNELVLMIWIMNKINTEPLNIINIH